MGLFRRGAVTTIKVEPSAIEQWLAIPDRWPWQGYRNGSEWGAFVAQVFGDAYGWPAQEREWCAEVMRSLAEDRPQDEYRYVWIDPQGSNVFFAAITAAPTEDQVDLQAACGVGDPTIVRAVAQGEFETEGLGVGYRHHRFLDTGGEDHDIVGMITYAFQHAGMAVVVQAAVFDVLALEARLDDLDDLARAISVVEV